MELEPFRSSFYTRMRSTVQKDQSPLRTPVSRESVPPDCNLAGFAYFTYLAHSGLVRFAYIAHFVHFGRAGFACFGRRRMLCSRERK